MKSSVRRLRSRGVLLGAAALVTTCARSPQYASEPIPTLGIDGDQIQPTLATAVDDRGGLWVMAGYTDLSAPARHSVMGLGIRSPLGTWQTHAPLASAGGLFQPSGDAWLASAQHGSRVYYASLANDADSDDPPNGVGEGVALAVIDVASGTPVVTAPRRIDGNSWDAWDEPTVSATRPPGASADTVLLSATPIGADVQDDLAVFVSNDGAARFTLRPLIHAPGYRHHVDGPDNTIVRPYLQQDPRPGSECHAFLAFGIRYATALLRTRGILPPPCASASDGCRSIAETETFDCGATWSDPKFIVVDTGTPSAPDYRGFSFAVASDGSRAVMYCNQASGDTQILVKRAAPGASFSVVSDDAGTPVWNDADVEVITASRSPGASVRLSRPTLAASEVFAAFWIQEDQATGMSSARSSTSAPGETGIWSAPRSVEPRTDGPSCNELAMPFDNYMGVTPFAPFGVATRSFLLAWTGFARCNGDSPHHIVIGEVP